MDWVMCPLPMAVCFVGVLFSVKVSKKHKRILAAAGVMLFLCVTFGSLAVYRVQKITKPIRESDTLAVAEMNLNSFRGDVEMNDLQTDASTELYQALEEYLGKKLYLPCINQDAFDAGGQDVVLQFGSDDEAKVWLAFYADSRICLVNGKKAYVFPGGKAVYPSSVLMNVMPAKVAGVDEIIMVTPPGKNGKVSPNTLVAAKEAGVNKIYKVGGAQAIAALAYGTESIPKVDKIVGPGNIYVALAKKAVYGHVSIDSIAGPSEILVVADETANPRYVAADLLSQAEHDELASAILVTTSEKLAHEVSDQVDGFLKELSRAEIISKSLDNYGYILLADTMEDVIDVANEIASEHLEIQTKNPFEVMTKIRNAGAIFIGEYASEPLGDYFAGPNHILPTNGTAKFFSPLSVDDFIKKSSIISYSREALQKVHKDIESFAKAEQLTAHANSIHVRFEEED